MSEAITRPRQDEEPQPQPAPAGESAGSMARTGVLLGMAGLFILNLVFGPIAIGLGAVVLRHGARPGAERATALACVLLGAADVIVLLVLVALSLVHGGMVWHFGS